MRVRDGYFRIMFYNMNLYIKNNPFESPCKNHFGEPVVLLPNYILTKTFELNLIIMILLKITN